MKRGLSLFLLTGCLSQLPGTPVATYRIVMKLAENTCGSQAVHETNGHSFSVELRKDDRHAHAYWRRADRPAIQGTLDADNEFKFTWSAVVGSEEPDAGPNGCQIVQDDVVTGKLQPQSAVDGGLPADAGPDVPSKLIGEHLFRITGRAGTDCSRALLAAGGPFEALPCVVRYTLEGVERTPF